MTASVVAVNVVHAVTPGYFGDTAIDKRPVQGPVRVDVLGLDGDQQLSSVHGGPDKAVYVYAAEDAEWWASELGREIPPGQFGENLTVRELEVTGAIIGERWQVGPRSRGVVLEVRQPRTPCENLSARMGIERFHVQFNRTGRVGALCQVLTPGEVSAGDDVRVVSRPDHGVTVADLATGPSLDAMRRLVESEIPLAKNVRAKARRIVDRAAGAS